MAIEISCPMIIDQTTQKHLAHFVASAHAFELYRTRHAVGLLIG
jgi:hypothetical protein